MEEDEFIGIASKFEKSTLPRRGNGKKSTLARCANGKNVHVNNASREEPMSSFEFCLGST